MSHHEEKWAVLDCGKYPSDNNCRMRLTCPAENVDELVDLACNHACKSHGHQDSEELREGIRSLVEYQMI